MVPMPRFQLGEQVIVNSVSDPACNGRESVIRRAHYGAWHSRDCNRSWEGWAYRLSFKSDWWAKSALRKKPEPSSKTFAELMFSIKSEGFRP